MDGPSGESRPDSPSETPSGTDAGRGDQQSLHRTVGGPLVATISMSGRRGRAAPQGTARVRVGHRSARRTERQGQVRAGVDPARVVPARRRATAHPDPEGRALRATVPALSRCPGPRRRQRHLGGGSSDERTNLHPGIPRRNRDESSFLAIPRSSPRSGTTLASPECRRRRRTTGLRHALRILLRLHPYLRDGTVTASRVAVAVLSLPSAVSRAKRALSEALTRSRVTPTRSRVTPRFAPGNRDVVGVHAAETLM